MIGRSWWGRARFGIGVTSLLVSSCASEPRPDGAARPMSTEAARLAGLERPVRLVGMRADAVEALLGRPDLERHERRAQYRRYDVDGCALDLYLYEAPTNGAPSVAWFEVRPVDPLAGLDSRACAWLEERLGAPSLQERRAEQARS
ncbi:MAG: hypothetical protein K6T74_06065 [Geminicoccaceae bacterium]|nr:hypothetical protein [Geminicoccaceae bacterium]